MLTGVIHNLIRPAPLVAAVLSVTLTGCASNPQYDTPPLTPNNLSPGIGTNIVINAETRFVWTPSAGAEHYDFHVFDRSSGDISKYYQDRMMADDVCDESACSVSLSIALPYLEDHAWRVRAGNPSGKSNWTRSLFNMVNSGVGPIGQGPALEPVPLAPLGGTLAAGDMTSFAWQAAENAVSYDFHLFNRVDGSLVHELTDVPAATVCQQDGRCQLIRSLSLPVAEGHAWRVRAANQFGRSAWTRTVFDVRP